MLSQIGETLEERDTFFPGEMKKRLRRKKNNTHAIFI